MLRRRSLKSKTDLKRRKSVSSSQGGAAVFLEHLDPALARRDACAAACEAYTRAARGRLSMDTARFPPTPERGMGGGREGGSGVGMDGHGDSDGGGLGRRQSVRFVGPCSVQARGRRGAGGRDGCRSEGGEGGSGNTQEGGGVANSQSHGLGHGDADPDARIPSPPRRPPPPIPLPKMATGYLAALEAQDEYYTPEDDIASAPSSYRRLHRSKSMFTDHQGFRKSHDSSVPFLSRRSRLPPPDSRRLFRSDGDDSKVSHGTPTLKAPKSMSFLRNRNSQSRSSTSHDGAIRDARLSSLPGLSEDGVTDDRRSTPQNKYKASTLFGSRRRQTETRLRASLRSSTPIEAMGVGSPGPGIPLDAPGTLRSKARKASQTLKGKLKSLFALAKPEEEASLPCQHIESQRSCVNDGFAMFQKSNSNDEAPSNEGCGPIHDVPTKMPSFQLVPPDLRSTRASLESPESEADRKVSDSSSLTSWVHSGPSTLTSQQQQQWREWEKQRLSVIRETGTHAPSPSMWRQPLGTGLFDAPESGVGEGVVSRPVVDSQRVYSALMKRMRAMKPVDGEAPGEVSGCSVSAGEQFDRPSERTPDTIRRVITERKYGTPSDSMVTPTRPSKRASLSRGQLSQTVSFTTDSETQFQTNLTQLARDNSSVFPHPYPLPHPTESSVARSDCDSPTPTPNTPASHAFRTTSPYRRALRRSMQEEQNAWSQRSCSGGAEGDGQEDSDTGTQVHHHPDNADMPGIGSDSTSGREGLDLDLDLDYTESVYSTDDGGKRVSVVAEEEESTPTAYRRPVARDLDRGGGTEGGIDWKTWLSTNMDKYDPSPLKSPSERIEFALPSMPRSFPSGHFAGRGRTGHVREEAQIYDGDGEGDGDDDVFEPRTRMPTLPTTTTAEVTGTTPLGRVEVNVVRESPSSSPFRRGVKRVTNTPTSASSPKHGIGSPGGRTLLVENENPQHSSLPPPIPPRSKLRPAPAPSPLRTVRSSRYGESIMSSPGLTEAVRRQFGPVFGEGDGGHGRERVGGVDEGRAFV